MQDKVDGGVISHTIILNQKYIIINLLVQKDLEPALLEKRHILLKMEVQDFLKVVKPMLKLQRQDILCIVVG